MSIGTITKPPDDGGGFAAGPQPRLRITRTYIPAEGETPAQTERNLRHIDRMIDALIEHYD
jgi:hypothetical protein